MSCWTVQQLDTIFSEHCIFIDCLGYFTVCWLKMAFLTENGLDCALFMWFIFCFFTPCIIRMLLQLVFYIYVHRLLKMAIFAVYWSCCQYFHMFSWLLFSIFKPEFMIMIILQLTLYNYFRDGHVIPLLFAVLLQSIILLLALV